MSFFNTLDFNPSNLTAFGDFVTSEMTPVLQIGFTYGLLDVDGVGTTSGTGASVDGSLQRLRVQSGTTATTGTAIYRSKKPAVYREGQGMTARFTGAFDSGAVGNAQEVGAATAIDGYMYGFNPSTGLFGVLHRNSSTGSLVETWTAQADFNGTVPSGFDPSKGNTYMIRYPYLGYGNVFFFIMDQITGKFTLAHTIRYNNSATTTQNRNPTLGFWVRCANTGANTTNKTIYVGSAAIFLNGQFAPIDSQFALDHSKATISTETNIISIKNCTNFNGLTNGGVIRLRSISFGGNLAGANPSGFVNLRIKKGVTLGGSPSYVAVSGSTADSGTAITSGQSVASYDTAGTTITGGTTVFNASANMNNGFQIDLLSYNIYILATEVATISIQCSSAATAFLAINWMEDI